LNLTWSSIGGVPEIVTLRRGDWEEVLIPGRPAVGVPASWATSSLRLS
jgi:hypothetical protein